MKLKTLLKYCVRERDEDDDGSCYTIKDNFKVFIDSNDFGEFDVAFVYVRPNVVNLMCSASELEEVIRIKNGLNSDIEGVSVYKVVA